MYGVPADLDLAELYGGSLDQICIGPSDLQPRFSTGHHFSVWGGWKLVESNGALLDEALVEEPGNRTRSGWRISELLAETVTTVEIDPPQSLSLRFNSGRTLTLFDDSQQYESFLIQPGNICV